MTWRPTGVSLAMGLAAMLAIAPGRAQQTPPPTSSSTPSSPSQADSSSATAAQTDGSATGPVNVDRIRRQLAQAPTKSLIDSIPTVRLDDSTFLVTVTEQQFDVFEFWGEKENAVPDYVRSWYFSNWHHEFQRMVTPEYGRRAALYPQGMVFIPVLDVVNLVQSAAHRRAEARARAQVLEELEEFFRQHPEARVAVPGAPGSVQQP